jgi:hypothetical protein
MRTIAILQSNYIPWIGYFHLMHRADIFVIYDDVQFTKNDWRNRNIIKTPNGWQWITIPVRQEKLEQRINETKISLKNWNVKHWKTLQANYAKTPYFSKYAPVFEKLYSEIDSEYLSEINLAFIKAINEILNIKTELVDSSSLQLTGNRSERLLDAVEKLNGDRYLSGPSAKDYLQVDLFEKQGIKVDWMEYSGYKEYPQMYPPFTQRVTVLDLIFNVGGKIDSYLNCP